MMNVFEKIREKLEEYHEHCVNAYGIVGGNSQAFATKQCIEIVNQVEQEHNNGWIACSERLPEEGTEVIVTDKNGSVWSDIYFDYKDEEDASPCFHRWDDEMWQCFTPDVLAWMPLPQPYKERDTNGN